MTSTASAGDVLPSPVALLRRDELPHPERAIRTRKVVSVRRGVYADADEWSRLAPWNRYLARVHATALVLPEARFVLESAAALRGLPIFGEPADVHITATPLATSRAVAGVRVHTAERLPLVEEIGGMLVARPADIAVDIARVRHHAVGLAVAGTVLRRHPELTPAVLHEVNRLRVSSRGRRHARWVLDRASPVPESTLEHVSLAVIEWLGFPAPVLQKWICGRAPGDADRLDFWWEYSRIGGEADGDVKYSDTDAVTVLRARRDRDARLLARGVAATAHWGWHDVIEVAPLRAALLAVGLQPSRPEDSASLRSLTRLLTPLRR